MPLQQYDTFEEAIQVADEKTIMMAWQGIFETPDDKYVYYGDFIGKPHTHKEAMFGHWTLVAERYPHAEHLSPGKKWTFLDKSFDSKKMLLKYLSKK